MKQTTLVRHPLDEVGLIVLSKTGRPMCRRCGHFLSDKSHPDENGLFRFTIWCECDCYLLYNRDGTPKKLTPADEIRLKIYGHL